MASPSLWCWCFYLQADPFTPQLQEVTKDALAVLKDESNPLPWRYTIFVVDSECCLTDNQVIASNIFGLKKTR